jgi:caa(3)-type oxidase subunit IV
MAETKRGGGICESVCPVSATVHGEMHLLRAAHPLGRDRRAAGAPQFTLVRGHIAAALAFAIAKASLIVLFFMHARYSGPITRLVMVVAIVWLAILVLGTMDDFLTRGWLGVPGH